MAKAGSVTQFILKQLFRSADLNSLTAELGADPIIGHDEDTGTRCDFDIGDALSVTVGHIVKHIYQREGYKIKTINAAGVVVHTADLTSINTIDIPVGGIIWWYKDLPGVPALPSGWVECNGQTLNDPESLLDGRVIPNINGQGYFIRGNATSGTIQTSQNLSHSHTQLPHNHTQDSHNHIQNQHHHIIGDHNHQIPVGYGTGPYTALTTGNAYAGSQTISLYTDDDVSDLYITDSTIAVNQAVTATNQSATAVNQSSGSTEARPINISMVAIMRVK